MSGPQASRTPWTLGLSFSHNGAACLLHGDEIAVAVQEERLTRRKRARIVPERTSLAVQCCLDTVGIGPGELDAIGLCSQLPLAGAEAGVLLREQLAVERHGTPLFGLSHHMGHAVHAFAGSGFSEAAVLVVDGLGSPPADQSAADKCARLFGSRDGWESISLYHARAGEIRVLEKHLVAKGEWLLRRGAKMPLFRSLGGMYSAVAQQIFGDEMEAGKVMGLAPYGTAEFPVGDFFDIHDGHFLFKDTVPAHFEHDSRWPDDAARYQALAASVQNALEHAILHLARRAADLTASENLCYAGGVALNVTTNERLHRETAFRQVHIPAAAEDSGPAVGAAIWARWSRGGVHTPKRIRSDAFGRHYPATEADTALSLVPGLRRAALGESDVLREAAARLAGGQVGGWFQGGSELGPRALGQRSILADPRDARAKDRLNSKVKFREAFRPFAPAVLAEKAGEWFDIEGESESEFMLRAWPVRPDLREAVPAIVHVDGTGRAQTVARDAHPRFHRLIAEFAAATGVPMLVNTSFNVHGEPIVETPEDALWCFLMTGLDFCVIEDRLMVKGEGRDALLRCRPQFTGELGSAQAGQIAYRVVTRWGPRELHLSAAVAPLLALADGTRTIRDIAAALQRSSREPLPERGVADLLVYLRRANVIALLAPS